ncbi:MAG TPA: hypothetical protein VGF95_15865 [Solirubrobacteraceae bacterium]|jgi:hypothetical protein
MNEMPWRSAPRRAAARMLGRKTASAALVGALALVCAAPALAWRTPGHSERRAIARVARQTPHAGSSRVSVGDIRVSTVGPWASATVTIYFESEPDEATDILHKLHGRWVNAGAGTAGEWCVMPTKDQRNLGFSAGYPCK